jgi:serine/threonine-protein kinase ATR
MATLATSTAFPPEFSNVGGDSDPAEFLKFLQAMMTRYLSDDSPRITEGKDVWVTIVDGLADSFLQSFPLPDMTLWDLMEEKVAMTETTLQIIQRVFSRVDGIYNNAEVLVKKLFRRLVDLCSVLDIWLETNVIYNDGIISPMNMKNQASNIIVSFLRGMGNNTPLLSSDGEQSWKILRSVLQESVDVCQGKLTLEANSGPSILTKLQT